MKLERYVLVSMLLAGAIVLSYFEGLIPIPIPLPGFKLGLANIIVIVMIYKFSFKESFALLLGRIFIVSLLRGSFLNLPFLNSLAGGLLSFFLMYFMTKLKVFSISGVSVIGAISHTIGQIIVVILVTDTPELALFYMPLLMIISIVTGLFNSIVAKRFLDLNVIDNMKNKNQDSEEI